jgi:DNA-binding NarL/FixJ family response regulator
MNLLIIDDHKLFNDGLKSLLIQEDDFDTVEQVYDSRETLKAIHLHAPDVILMDFNMPHINGLEMTEQILKNFPQQKIIILSMYAQNTQIEQFRKLGVKGYLLKTVEPSELCNAVSLVKNGENIFPKSNQENNHSEDSFLKKFRLTQREYEVIKLIKEGKSSSEISDMLHLSIHTVVTHRKNIHLKLDIQNERELIKFTLENGF